MTNTMVPQGTTARWIRANMAGLVLAGALSVACAQPTYRLQIFPVFYATGGFLPEAINEQGHVAGIASSTDGIHAMVLKDGVIEDRGLGTPEAINERGQMVGTKPDRRGLPRAARWGALGSMIMSRSGMNSAALDINDRGEAAGFTRVDEPPLPVPYATRWYRGETTYYGLGFVYAINDAGRLAGFHLPGPNDPMQAASWQDDTMTLLGTPGSWATGINNLGQMVGTQSNRAHLWDSGATIELGAPSGSGSSVAYDINLSGEIVGTYMIGSGSFDARAALWRKAAVGYEAIDLGSMLRPGAPEAGWVLTSATKLNDRGDIIGNAMNIVWCTTTTTCDLYGFLLTHSSLPDEYPTSSPP